MTTRTQPARRNLLAAITTAAALALVACAPTGGDSERVVPASQPVYPELATYPDVQVIADVPYTTVDSTTLYLDACLPPDNPADGAARASIVSIHGGSWSGGDKASVNWRSVCQWFASEGFFAVSVNYRLAPEFAFPAQLHDVQAAVAWLREPAQSERYNLDPARIGAFGGSAGGHLAALLGASGTGDLNTGSRVAAVADLSGPVDLRGPIPTPLRPELDFGQVQLDFLGCASFPGCAAATLASPHLELDESDPPFFVAHSVDEFIPLEQAETFVERLRAASVDTTYVTLEGGLHSIAMLDETMRSRVISFFRDVLGGPPSEVLAQEEAPSAGSRD